MATVYAEIGKTEYSGKKNIGMKRITAIQEALKPCRPIKMLN